jgi:RNA polymerase sigma factor for flagellar operon FliA
MVKKQDINDPRIQQLIEDKKPLVESIARNLVRRLPASVECNDLIQDGLMGLIDALLRWTRETAGGHFDRYVAQRAHGAMLDGLRAIDPAPRQVRSQMRRVEIAIQTLGHQLGRNPSEGEVAQAMGLALADYQRMLQDAHGYSLISLEDLGDGTEAYLEQCASRQDDPLVVLQRAALRQALTASISALPEQKKTVLRLYYEEDQRMHEVGKALGISEARVSQLHMQTIAQLRADILGGESRTSILKPRSKPRAPAASTPPV